MTRQTKTPRQRAEETLAAARRRHHRLTTARDALADQLEDLDEQLVEAEARLTYAQQDPALATPATSSTDTSGGTTA